MSFVSRGRFNWGCLLSMIVGAVVLPSLFGGLMFGGGGCEGHSKPCDSDFTLVWIIMIVAIIGLALLGWLTNRLISLVLGMIGGYSH